MKKVSILTQDFITYKIALQTRKLKYVKIQDQVANIFIKPLKYDVFIKMRDVLRVMKKSSLRRDVESKLISGN
jgi:hypothetical protein